MPNVPNSAIQETWEIRESPPSFKQAGYPFVVVRTGETGHETLFICQSLEEAQDKLNAVARAFDKNGHVLAIA